MKSLRILIGFLLKNKQSSPLVCTGLISTCDYIPISNKTAHALKDLLLQIQQGVEAVADLLGVGLVAVVVGEVGYVGDAVVAGVELSLGVVVVLQEEFGGLEYLVHEPL